MVGRPHEKQNKISAHLLRPTISKPEDALRELTNLSSVPFPIGDVPGVFYWAKASNRTPSWVPFLEGLPSHVVSELKSRSASAVLFLHISGRWFAVCFGFGHAFIDGATIEPEFGLRAGLMAIDPDRIRSLEASSLDRTGSNRRVQAAVPTSFVDLGLDSERNLITSVMGAPKSDALGNRVHGRDAIQWSSKVLLKDLPSVLQSWLNRYSTANLEQTFPGWRQMRPVTDRVVTGKLDDEVVERLKISPHDRIWIAIPEVVDWEIVEGFVYGRARKQTILPDIDTDSFCAWFGNLEQLSIDSLKREEVSEIVGGAAVKHWKIYKCIYAEIEQGGATFVLVNGLWFKVDNNFVEVTNAQLAGRWTKLEFLTALYEKEKEYNKRIANESDGRLVTVDCKCVMHGGGRSRLEVCDLLDRADNGRLIHVKCYGNSNVLSYLFDQGIVSARCLSEDVGFRQKVSELMPESHRKLILDMPERKPEVVYAIATKKESLDEKGLPFFSRVILASYIRELEGRGFKVVLTLIRDMRKRATPAKKRWRGSSKLPGVEPYPKPPLQ